MRRNTRSWESVYVSGYLVLSSCFDKFVFLLWHAYLVLRSLLCPQWQLIDCQHIHKLGPSHLGQCHMSSPSASSSLWSDNDQAHECWDPGSRNKLDLSPTVNQNCDCDGGRYLALGGQSLLPCHLAGLPELRLTDGRVSQLPIYLIVVHRYSYRYSTEQQQVDTTSLQAELVMGAELQVLASPQKTWIGVDGELWW